MMRWESGEKNCRYNFGAAPGMSDMEMLSQWKGINTDLVKEIRNQQGKFIVFVYTPQEQRIQ